MKQKLIFRHREIQTQIASLQHELSEIERNPLYEKELKWAKDLEALMASHGKSAEDVVHLLGANVVAAPNRNRGSKVGIPRKRNTYRNPHTGEEIQSASGNHKILKDWKTKYPNDDIKTWIK